MKLTPYILIFILVIQVIACADKFKQMPHLVLTHSWKFKPGDDMKYLSIKYNDSDWDTISVSKSWQKQGFPFVGFAWYRIKIVIPSSLKSTIGDSLKIVLGKIKDCDQVFFNEEILGENGELVSRHHKLDSQFTYYGKAGFRKYIIPITDGRILWDKENLLAVRVFDKGERGGGGLTESTPHIGIVGLEDSISFEQTFYKPDPTGNLNKNLVMINNSSRLINGKLYINGRRGDKIVYDENIPIKLNPSESQSIPIELSISLDETKIFLLFEEHTQKVIVEDSLTVPFVLAK